MGKITSCKDLIILLLYARGHTGKLYEPIEGRTRLMKMIFIFGKELRQQFNMDKIIAADAFPNFEPYDFGPFAADVYADLEFLVNEGFVSVEKNNSIVDIEAEEEEYHYWKMSMGEAAEREYLGGFDVFTITKTGRSFVEQKAIGEFSDKEWGTLNQFKEKCTKISLKTLLRYVYDKYPETAINSKIVDKLR